MNSENNHGNKTTPVFRRPKPVRKVPANSVPYGESISRNGRHVWVGLEDERVICVAATADEARRKVRDIENARASELSRALSAR